ncbi:MAG: XdhC family protein [Deltaproteobacteria bacterium]|nr:XdhC family protein [Deltaproteobacteria bacterium]
MIDFYAQINREISGGGDIVLATIVGQQGSAPRTTGTHFIVRPDGSFSGTIGGGKLEAEVLQTVPQVFAERKNKLLCFRLKGTEVAQTEMICGGEVDVYLELLSGANPFYRQLFKGIADLARSGREALLATQVRDGLAADREDLKVLLPTGLGEPSIPASVPEWLRPYQQRLKEALEGDPLDPAPFRLENAGFIIFVEPLKPAATVYLFGAGHISRPLCQLAKLVDFRVVVVDDREEFANRTRFPEADEIWVRSFDLDPLEFPLGPNAYVVIITRGHLHDHQLLRQVLPKPVRYIGMIGSRHKREVVFKALRREGFAEDLIKTVHAPIGLAINAQTPEEIAVSIAAELIQVRGAGQPPQKNWSV